MKHLIYDNRQKKEIALLNEILDAPKAEMITIIGRRRVGKTFLVDQVYKDRVIFKQTGVRNASNEEQLRTFTRKLEELADKKLDAPKIGWMLFSF